jgi:hypothetical protein
MSWPWPYQIKLTAHSLPTHTTKRDGKFADNAIAVERLQCEWDCEMWPFEWLTQTLLMTFSAKCEQLALGMTKLKPKYIAFALVSAASG